MPDDGEQLATSLTVSLAALRFADSDADQVSGLLIDAIVVWATAQGWRVYRRARSVMSLPPPYADRHSWVDVACARPGAGPVVIEVDRSDRRRTIEKLLAEARSGRVALWVRWGTGTFAQPPPPVWLVGCPVTSRRDRVSGRRLYASASGERAAPTHSAAEVGEAEQADLF